MLGCNYAILYNKCASDKILGLIGILVRNSNAGWKIVLKTITKGVDG